MQALVLIDWQVLSENLLARGMLMEIRSLGAW